VSGQLGGMIPASVGWQERGRAFTTRVPGRGCALVLLCLLPPALSACGTQAPGALDAGDALALQHAIAAVRTSAARGERAAALDGLDGLRARIERLGAAGKLRPAQQAALHTGVAQALAAARRELHAPAPTEASSTPAPAPSPPPSPSARKQKSKGLHEQPGHGRAKHGDGGGD
jgi:hypothetical protein